MTGFIFLAEFAFSLARALRGRKKKTNPVFLSPLFRDSFLSPPLRRFSQKCHVFATLSAFFSDPTKRKGFRFVCEREEAARAGLKRASYQLGEFARSDLVA